MDDWELNFENYRAIWRSKGIVKARKELESYTKGLSRHRDTFFHESAPDELSDGDRVMALRDVINELSELPSIMRTLDE